MTGRDSDRQHPGAQSAASTIEPAELRRIVAADAEQTEQIEQRTDERVGAFERTQGLIATSIIGLFLVIVVVLIAAYLLAPFAAAADRIMAGADKARELANTLLLPIVTLVLGYYFGKRAD